ncbi:DNA-directed RNA polymerase III subunit RPC9 [Sigmodon hispidus]
MMRTRVALHSNYEVYQLLTDLKEQRKEHGKNKHSAGQQNLRDIKIHIKNAMQESESRDCSRIPHSNEKP